MKYQEIAEEAAKPEEQPVTLRMVSNIIRGWVNPFDTFNAYGTIDDIDLSEETWHKLAASLPKDILMKILKNMPTNILMEMFYEDIEISDQVFKNLLKKLEPEELIKIYERINTATLDGYE